MKHTFFMVLAAVVLAMPSWAQEQEQEWHYTQGWMPDGAYSPSLSDFADVKAAATPQNISDLVAKMPAVPAVEQIYSIEAKEKAIRATYQPFAKALEAALLRNQQDAASVDRRMMAAGKKKQASNKQAMAQYQSNVNAGLMPSQEEIMQLYMSGEIKENMSDEQMMDVMAGKFAAKWGVSKQEYIKIISMAQSNPKACEAYLQSNHPDLYKRLYAANAQYGDSNVQSDDPRVPAFDRISDELMKAQEDLTAAVNAYGHNVIYTGGTSEYDKLLEQMRREWDNSPEAKQIESIEEALQKRIDEWYKTVTIKGDVSYPAWFTAERQKENALIDQWNKRWAAQWLKIAQEGDKKIRPIYAHVAELDAENEQLGKQGDQEDMHYLANKKLVSTLFGYALHVYTPVNDAISFPSIEHVLESGTVIVEK